MKDERVFLDKSDFEKHLRDHPEVESNLSVAY